MTVLLMQMMTMTMTMTMAMMMGVVLKHVTRQSNQHGERSSYHMPPQQAFGAIPALAPTVAYSDVHDISACPIYIHGVQRVPCYLESVLCKIRCSQAPGWD